MSLKDHILDLFFPPRCIFCGTVLSHGSGNLCAVCEKNLPFVEDSKVLRKIGKYTCAVTFYYEGAVQQGILAMKFHGRRNRVVHFAPYLARQLPSI